jgi:hypothetical protein
VKDRLDYWERDAKEFIVSDTMPSHLASYCPESLLAERFVKLVELVRKKDELITDIFKHFEGKHKDFCKSFDGHPFCSCGFTWLGKTLALTEELK